jgi:hypothetical protein
VDANPKNEGEIDREISSWSDFFVGGGGGGEGFPLQLPSPAAKVQYQWQYQIWLAKPLSLCPNYFCQRVPFEFSMGKHQKHR